MHIGPGGAGHYVKMVHNGIEYGDMQLICEAYALFKATGLTSASWAAVASDANVEMDTSATAMTVGTIVDIQYVKSTNQSSGTINQPAAYNWDLQLGSSLTGTSDIYTLGIRVLSGSSGAAIGSLTFYDLTQ